MEIDFFRLMVRSFENFPPEAVDNLPQKKFFDILKPKEEPRPGGSPQPASSAYPFRINLEFKNNLALIRHHVQQRVSVHLPFHSSGKCLLEHLKEILSDVLLIALQRSLKMTM